jgi:hypothetical protein
MGGFFPRPSPAGEGSPVATAWDKVLSVSTAVLAVATIALVAGVWFARATLVATRRATQLESYVDLLREYRSTEMREARRRIRAFTYTGTLEQISSDADREAAEMVANYLDQVGTLVKFKLLDIKPASAFLGGSAINMWVKLQPIIRAEQEKGEGRGDYQAHFEFLVDELRRVGVGFR